ncbi:hypothetical protein [Algibacter sp. R77976]|uniref:hypothetical protein n=1 Tax=Algibacter sp. R77976 TaxID=3093873 RepID=UPI0037CBC14C
MTKIMVKTSKIRYYTISTILSIIISLVSMLICGADSIFTFFLFLIPWIFIFHQDTVSVDVNKVAILKDRWTGELLKGNYPEGFYWTKFFSAIIYDERNATPNKYSITTTIDTRNNIRGKIQITLWAQIIDLYKYNRIGAEDVKDKILHEIEESGKTYFNTKTDYDIRHIQNSKSTNLFESLFSPHMNNTQNVLKECGLEYDFNKLKINIGTFIAPNKIIDADLSAEISTRYSKALDIENLEKSKRVNNIFIEDLIIHINPTPTKLHLKKAALKLLELNESEALNPRNEYIIIEEMLAIAKAASKLPNEKLEEMKNLAETKYNIREGRTKDYRGLNNSFPFIDGNK